MINFRVIARVFSLLLIVEGLFMLVCAGVSFMYQEKAAPFIYSALITTITGTIAYTPLNKEEKISGHREGYIIVAGFWILFSLFATIPYLFSGSVRSFSDAFFEAMSGFTTTGATIFRNVESLPHGILFWRSLTQWLGGMGIIFISLSIFPVVRSINIQIAAVEFSGYHIEKIHPRIIDSVRRLLLVYVILTLAETMLLMAGGLPLFDSICHSFSTLSTGGFSTRNGGISSFGSPYLMLIITIFMFLAGTNPALIYFVSKGKFRKTTGNNEFMFYFWICLAFITLSTVILAMEGSPVLKALSDGSFHIVSIITTTGFYTQNYGHWGYTMVLIIFILMFVGATAGSTSGGLKMVRLLLVTKSSRQELKRLIHPNAFLPVKLNNHIVPANTIGNVLIFLIIYFFVLSISTLTMGAMGYDMLTSFSTSASMLSNLGPALGSFPPTVSYAGLPLFGKIFLPFLMLLGRLELLTIMILFTRSFYRS